MRNLRFKFRAWDDHRKEMVTNFILAPTSPDWAAFPIERPDNLVQVSLREMEERKGYLFPCGDYTLTDWSNYYGIEHYKIMQWTGIIDIDGNEIYEGDIVKNEYGEMGIIIFQNGAFVSEYIEPYNWDKMQVYDGILNNQLIIGNIYENPELLKRR